MRWADVTALRAAALLCAISVLGCKTGRPLVSEDASTGQGSGGTSGTGGSGDGGSGDGGVDRGADTSTGTAASCTTGQHMCSAGCASNTDIKSCGSSCSPCQAPPGGGATCDGQTCGASCPAGTRLCNSVCVEKTVPCTVVDCPPGTHACGEGICLSTMNVNACGSSCMPCPTPGEGAQATCDGTKCDFKCGVGYHRCSDRCATNDDSRACGDSCTSCPIDPNGVAQCQGGGCALVCNTGFHNCGGHCVGNREIASCGPAACEPCTIAIGGSTICDGMACQSSCPSGMRLCMGACFSTTITCEGNCPTGSHDCGGLCKQDSPTYCGTSCAVCPLVTNGAATCTSGVCGTACDSGYKLCPSKLCVPTAACCTATDCPQSAPVCSRDHVCEKRITGSTCAANQECASGICCSTTQQCVDPGPEVCDKGSTGNSNAYGGCLNSCRLGPRCGDGYLNGPEQCDNGTANNTGAYGGCKADCTWGPRCGDGVRNGTEVCDEGDNNSPAVGRCNTSCTGLSQ